MALFADGHKDDVIVDVVGYVDLVDAFQPAVVVRDSGGLRRVAGAANVNADPLATDPPSTAETDRRARGAGPRRELEPWLGIQHFELGTVRRTALFADQVQRERAG